MAKVRGFILDLSNNEGQAFAQNPEQFEETYSAVREARAALAGTHQRRQFKHTANPTVSIDLLFNRKLLADLARSIGNYDEAWLTRILPRAKAFFASLASPRQHRGTVLLQSPPPVLLVWPKVLRIRAELDECVIRNREFAEDASLVEFVAAMKFTEQRTKELFSADIRRLGSLRGGDSG